MSWQYHPYVFPCLVTTFVAGSLALLTWKRRRAPGALPLLILMLGVMEWSLAYAFGLGSITLPAKITWAQIQYFGILVLPPAYLALALQFTGQVKYLRWRYLALYSAIPLITLLLVWTNSYHGLIWSETRLVPQNGLLSLALVYGHWFWVATANAYLLLIIGYIQFWIEFLRRPRWQRGQVLIFLVGGIFPVLGNLIRLLGLNPTPDLDLTPMAFTVSGAFLVWGLLFVRLFDINSIARSAVLESMSEGVLVVDLQNRLVDLNPAAERFIHRKADQIIGQDMAALFPDQPLLNHPSQNVSPSPQDLLLNPGSGERIYDLRTTALHDGSDEVRGCLLVLRDITQRRQTEVSLRESEERFRQISEAAFEAIAISDQGVLLDANHNFAELLGYKTVDEITGKSAEAFIAPESMESVWQHAVSGSEETYQIAAIKKNGTRLQAEVRGKTMHYQGRLVRVTALRDISERLESEKRLRQRADEMTTLFNLSLELTSPFDLPALLERIVEKAAQLLEGGGGGLYLCDPQRRVTSCVVSYRTPVNYKGTVLQYGEGAAGIVAETGKPLIIDDYRTWQGRAKVYDGDQPFRSVISVPLKWRNQVIGVIHVLNFEEGRSFTPEQLELLSLFAAHAAIAIQNADSIKEIQTYARRMALLNDLTHVGISAPDLEHMLRRLADRLGELFDANGTYITLWDAESQMPIPRAAYGKLVDTYGNIQAAPGEPTMTAAVLEAGRVLVTEDTSQKDYVSQRIASIIPVGAVMGLPLIADERKLGAALICYDTPRRFKPDEIALGEQAGAQVALAIAKAQSLEAERSRAEELRQSNVLIKQLAITDDLTGLYNRRGLMEFGKREVERALRFSRPLSAILLDIDHFKQVNDRYGHPLGDIVLRQLAECCRGNVRTIDITCRYGGDELFILLPESGLAQAVQVAERLRHIISELVIQTQRGDIRITFSAGVVELSQETHTLEQLFDQADRQLYRAKHNGRNRVSYPSDGEVDAAREASAAHT
jgi:diguanylate cyclase (GGDEF)-like protein/PAS domain S-box-containing protein